MARLIYVPVLHSPIEMGSQASAYKAAFVARYGERKWKERTADYDKIWREIEQGLESLKLDCKRVKLYQDSLPVCGREDSLVRELASQGSHNHQLLEALIAKGASLVGTESPALLLEEYKLLDSPDRTEGREAELLWQRDRFIADRIDLTLGDQEIGVLFIGALHKVADHLPRRIKVDYLVASGCQ